MGRKLFHSESLLWKPFGFLGELVMLSLLWAVCSIPLVTVGPATAALYDAVVHNMRRKENDLFSRFFHTFRAELKTGLLSTLLWAALIGLPLFLHPRVLAAAGAGATRPLDIALVLLLFFLSAILCWVFPTLSRFTFGFVGLNRTAAQLALGNILRSVVLVALTALGVALSWLFVAPVFFMPALVTLLASYLIEPVFRRYE